VGSSRGSSPFAARVLAALALAAASPAAAEGLYLHSIPIAETAGAPEGPARIRAFVADAQALAASMPAATRSVAAEHVDIELAPYPELEPRDPGRARAAAFVIDFDEPAVRGLRAELATRYGDSPSIDELRRFTGDSIPNKSMERGFDLASRVAGSGAGDCTEHAVLLTALARATGRPARVVLGVLVARIDGEPQAFGHAWAEIHEGGRWLPVDATPIVDEVEAPAYLPLSLLDNEGPGYAIGLGRAIQRSWVRRLEIGSLAAPAKGPSR
jgi:hypothetical protein